MRIPFKPSKEYLMNYPSEEFTERSSYVFVDINKERCYYLAHKSGDILIDWGKYNKINPCAGVSIFKIDEFKKKWKLKGYYKNACMREFNHFLKRLYKK